MKPIIGMTAMAFENNEMKVYRCNQAYVQAILDAGGVPVLLPANGANEDYAELAEHLDGLLIPGGADISTFLYGEEAIKQVTSMRSADDLFEFAVLRRMAELNKPILGICRGAQVINVAFGGTLYQDIPTQFPSDLCHYQKGPRYEPFHYVELEEGSRLKNILGTSRLAVNSFHHQAVKDVAPSFRTSAKAHDGLTEAIEHESKYILGVQFHPECLYDVHQEFSPIFRDFVAQAAKNK